jgi:hypothetical protein
MNLDLYNLYANNPNVNEVTRKNLFFLLSDEDQAKVKQGIPSAPAADVPEWTTPSHEDINLATVQPEDLGLDSSDMDDPLVDAIYRAKRQAQVDPFPSVPQELKNKPRWITWSGDTKQKKPFISGTNTPASTSNPEHLVSYDLAVKNVQQGLGYPHLGFVPEQPYVGIDMDSCRNPETGSIQPWATELLGLIGSTYVEVTPSQSGLRAWVKMPIDKKKVINIDPKFAAVPSKAPQVEPLVKNYGTITGQRYNNAPAIVAEITEERWNEIEKKLSRFAPAATKRESTGSPISVPPDVKQIVQAITAADGDIEAVIKTLPDVSEGGRDNFLISVLGKLHQSGWTDDNVLAAGERINAEKCSPPIKDPERVAKSACRYKVVEAPPVVFTGYDKPALPVVTTTAAYVDDSEKIPVFDESVITGIFRDIVDLGTRGTTIPPQFAFLNAKVYFGARLASTATFEGLDCDSSYYGAAIGITGTSKGESWKRTMEKILLSPTNLEPPMKIIHGADSGAGLKDAFFDQPMNLPIVCYVDEVVSLGHKAGAKKNPEILDTIIELADSHRISRVKAQRGKRTAKNTASMTHDNARLSLYMCGQDGEAFMGAFAGRTKMGLFDRLYPEYSDSIEAGDLPEISGQDILELHAKILQLNFACRMTMAPDTKTRLDEFWKAQPTEIRKKVRFKKYLMLDMYMAAFGRFVTVAEPQDLDVAIKIFNRQIVIRRVCFTDEIPDRVGFYLGHLKKAEKQMRKRLNQGEPYQNVAMSLRDLMTATNAYKENEEHVFDRAWKSVSGSFFEKVPVKGANGHRYEKFVPVPYEHETWLPAPNSLNELL